MNHRPEIALWSRQADQAAAAAVLGGLALLAGGYLGAKNQATISDQLAWLDLAVIGSVIAAAAQLLWLLAGRRRLAQLQNRVVLQIRQQVDAPSVSPSKPAGTVVVTGLDWYHRAQCPLARGKAVHQIHGDADLRPCEVCEPER